MVVQEEDAMTGHDIALKLEDTSSDVYFTSS